MEASQWLLNKGKQIVNYDDIEYINDELDMVREFNSRFIDKEELKEKLIYEYNRSKTINGFFLKVLKLL